VLAAGVFGTPASWDTLPHLMETAIVADGICGALPDTASLCAVRGPPSPGPAWCVCGGRVLTLVGGWCGALYIS
jgi:hypothetical protein